MVLAYDVTDEKTFANIEEWMNCIAENTQEFQIIQKVPKCKSSVNFGG